ncbi:hypothetical protein EYS14_14600 [Alteromonadaceae bacterium M269]|nr:hypothetical protein EYS14_14600 [Alteromonadaceae bacterium M269]
MKKLILLIALTLPTFANAVPTGDTQGKVSAVIVHHNFQRGYNSFSIWFNDIQNDRFNCLKDNGYITVRDNGVGVDAVNYQQMFSTALAAQTSGKTLALSSSGTSPCINVNSAWMMQ